MTLPQGYTTNPQSTETGEPSDGARIAQLAASPAAPGTILCKSCGSPIERRFNEFPTEHTAVEFARRVRYPAPRFEWVHVNGEAFPTYCGDGETVAEPVRDPEQVEHDADHFEFVAEGGHR